MSNIKREPSRGDIWLINLNPTKGREQAGIRPGLIISVDKFNYGPAELIIVLPITSKYKGIPLHIELSSETSGLKKTSYVKCEDIRSISVERLNKYIGRIESNKLSDIESILRALIGI